MGHHPPSAAPFDDDPVVRPDMGALDESSDMCLHSDSIDDADEELANDEEAQAALDQGGDDDDGYDDDFETSMIADAEGGVEESGVSDEVVDKLNETKSKIDLLERLLPPAKATNHESEVGSGDRVETGELLSSAAPCPQQHAEPCTHEHAVPQLLAEVPILCSTHKRWR